MTNKPYSRLRSHFLVVLLISVFLPGIVMADIIDQIRERGTVRIGLSPFAPWTFENQAGEWEGFEVDVGRQIADDLGVKAAFKILPLDQLIDAVANDEIDFIAAGLAITPERALRVEFSTPYFESGTTLVTNREKVPSAAKAEDLNKADYVIVVVEDSFSEHLATLLYDVAEIRNMPNGIAAEAALLEGEAHGYLTSVPDAHILTKRHADKLAQPLDQPLEKSVAGLAVRPGNQRLLNFLNSWIIAQTANRWIDSRHSYWFSSYDWIAHLKD